MSGYNYLKGSDGTGNAVLAHVTLARLAAATVLKVDSVSKWPVGGFIATVGTLDGTGFLTPASITEFTGHITGSDIIIDGFEAGFTDLGNSIGQVVVIKQTTGWANSMVTQAQVGHNDDGTHKDTALDAFLRPAEMIYDFIVPGGAVLTGTGYGATLAWNLTAGVCYINGKRYTIAAATGVVVATKDTYFDITAAASPGGVATLNFTGGNSVANNAASPALAANSIRLGIIQSGANIANVAAINQGQLKKLLPIAAGIPYTFTDSLGNIICPNDPNRKLIGYREIVGNFATTGSADITGLNLMCIPSLGKHLILTAMAGKASSSVANNGGSIDIFDVTAAANVLSGAGVNNASGDVFALNPNGSYDPPATGARNFKAILNRGTNASTCNTNSTPTNPTFLRIEQE